MIPSPTPPGCCSKTCDRFSSNRGIVAARGIKDIAADEVGSGLTVELVTPVAANQNIEAAAAQLATLPDFAIIVWQAWSWKPSSS